MPQKTLSEMELKKLAGPEIVRAMRPGERILACCRWVAEGTRAAVVAAGPVTARRLFRADRERTSRVRSTLLDLAGLAFELENAHFLTPAGSSRLPVAKAAAAVAQRRALLDGGGVR